MRGSSSSLSPAFAMIRGRKFSKIKLQWCLVCHHGSSRWSRVKGKAVEISAFLDILGFSPKLLVLELELSFYFSSHLHRETHCCWVGLRVSLMAYSWQHPFYSESDFRRRKIKGPPRHGRSVTWLQDVWGHWGWCWWTCSPAWFLAPVTILGWKERMNTMPLPRCHLKWSCFVMLRLAKPFTGVTW